MCTTRIRSSPTDGRTDSRSPSILSSSRNLFILADFNCHHLLWDSRGTSDPRGEEVFDWVISSDLLPLNEPETPTLLHRSSPVISFASSFPFLAPGRQPVPSQKSYFSAGSVTKSFIFLANKLISFDYFLINISK